MIKAFVASLILIFRCGSTRSFHVTADSEFREDEIELCDEKIFLFPHILVTYFKHIFLKLFIQSNGHEKNYILHKIQYNFWDSYLRAPLNKIAIKSPGIPG